MEADWRYVLQGAELQEAGVSWRCGTDSVRLEEDSAHNTLHISRLQIGYSTPIKQV